MTRDTAMFLRGLLNEMTINVGADNFPDLAQQFVTARVELDAVIAGGE